MAIKPRYFTVEQANDIVKAIRPMVREILRIRQEVIDKQPDVWPVISKAIGNGGSKAASELTQEFGRLETLTREINATGATLKDINTGLVDFLALRQGREVYLCWKYGEERIEYWHELDGGFAGRHRLV